MAEKSLEAHLYECLKEDNTKRALYIVELLGDKVNALYRGKSPLLWAKEFENDEVASVLEEKRAVEEAISEEEAEKLGIELVGKARKGDLDAVIELVEKGANVNEKDKYGDTALVEASFNGHLEIVERLIDADADVNQENNDGETALIRASESGRLEIVEKLIKAGADVNVENNDGETALMWASRNGYLEVVEKLIEKGADVNHQENEGFTALMWASELGRLEVIKTLIKAGAYVCIKNQYGHTALGLTKEEKTRRTILDAERAKTQKGKTQPTSIKWMDQIKMNRIKNKSNNGE